MLLTSLLVFAAGVASFTIPKGQPEGVYSVSVDSAGVETHTLLRLYNETSTIGTRDMVNSAKFNNKRQIGGAINSVGCGGYPLNPQDTDKANGMIDAQCGAGSYVGGNLDFYAIWGCTVSYFCNFNSVSDLCFAFERQAADRFITSACGLYIAGRHACANFCYALSSSSCATSEGKSRRVFDLTRAASRGSTSRRNSPRR